jgi:BCCT family betaine/carnitine transporter
MVTLGAWRVLYIWKSQMSNDPDSKISKPLSSAGNVDWQLFIAGSVILFSSVLVIVVFPEWSGATIDRLYVSTTSRFGILYVITAVALLFFLLYVAVSKYGTIILGDDAKAAYSHFSWASMLFCAGIGASLIYWGATEWAFYYESPPFGVEAGSQEAILWASSYGMFHWGPIGWSFYCLPALALACSYHVKKIPSLRLSSACEPVLKSYTTKLPGRLVDLFFLAGVIATAATGLGFGTSLVSSATVELTGIEDGLLLQICIILLATSLIAFSVYRGLDRGIKVLSTLNASMALVFIAFVFLFGPTKFILEMGIVSIGHVIQNFITMLFWTDPLQRSNFVESWTIFYWAWWLAMGPFIGMFVCKISQGRTIRELVFGMLGWGSLGCALFFVVLGNYALFMELEGNYPVVAKAVQASPASAIAGLVALLPIGGFWLFFVAVVGLIFMATTYDSASYTLAAGATKSLARNEHPATWHRVFWALALGFLPISLLFIGGLRELQTASLVASLPLLGIYVMLFVSTMRMLKEIKP